MKIGIPKEVKNHEYRIGITPFFVQLLIKNGHHVSIEKGAGEAIGFSDEDFQFVGANIESTPEEVYQSEMIIKVKDPEPSEYHLLKEGQILFCFLHLAADPKKTAVLLEKKVIGIAFETVTDHQGRLPLLMPMSEIAGRIAIQAGAYTLHMANGGRGTLLSGSPGVAPGKVVIIGGGVVGTQSARMAIGLEADVTILDNNVQRLRELDHFFRGRLKTLFSNTMELEEIVCSADLVIGAILTPGKRASTLVSKKTVMEMKKGAVIVDVAIDQGGCFETSRPTTHSNPTFLFHNVVHYCVVNMPGACAYTATLALTNSLFPYALRIANYGYKKALLHDPQLLSGLNIAFGKITNKHIANDLGYEFYPPEEVLQSL